MDDDVLNTQLIARLLEEDLLSIEQTAAAERFQLAQALADTTKNVKSGTVRPRAPSPVADVDVVLAFVRSDMADVALAQALQRADAGVVASQQAAQRLAAAERKLAVDAEYARTLQGVDDAGEQDVDDVRMQDVSGVLGKDVLEALLAADMNEKGKAKGTRHHYHHDAYPPAHTLTPSNSVKHASSSPTCNICFNAFTPTASPLAVSRQPSNAARDAYGLNLPCPQRHGYCLSCLRSHILAALGEPSDTFAVRCPECPPAEWSMSDAVAEKLLTESELAEWHGRKLLAQKLVYCPNPRCSYPFHLDDLDAEVRAECPACNTLMCTSCRVVWHTELSCEEYQALPVDEKLPEDRLVLELAKAKNWRRCYNCAAIVELVSGCNHITCKCGTHFCFKCGSLWDGRCTRKPKCELWDEENLLEDNEDRAAVARPAFEEPVRLRRNHGRITKQEFDWLRDPKIVSGRHNFTTTMVQTLECGYCHEGLFYSLKGLQIHLSNARHQVYACCGRLFKNMIDLERHSDAASTRFGEHIQRTIRD